MTIEMYDSFDLYDAVSALTNTGKWGITSGTLYFDTGRFGSPGQAVHIPAGSAKLGQGFSGVDGIHVGFAFKLGTAPSSNANVFLLRDATSDILAALSINSAGQLVLWGGSDSSGTILGSASRSIGTGTWHWIEFFMETGTSGKNAQVYLDGDIAISALNVGTTASTDQITQLIFGQGHIYNTVDMYLDDYVRFSDAVGFATDGSDLLGDSRVEVIRPTSDGTIDAEWTGDGGETSNLYDKVDDDAPTGDTAYIKCSTTGKYARFDSTDVLSSTPVTIHAVSVSVRANKDDAGTRTFKPVLNLSSTDYEGSALSLALGIEEYQGIWETNPDTAGAWSRSAVEAAIFGIKLET